MKYKTPMPRAAPLRVSVPSCFLSPLSLPHSSTIFLQELIGACLDLRNTPVKCTVHQSSTNSRDPPPPPCVWYHQYVEQQNHRMFT
ncbi:hypothetical protein E2C01_084748 [Portunus trituberculatus]|uniref:Uncharacterized protein n=1 Tax=Portunus trituberculatus TaxID=210409 RepID=A0A5B7JA39_PORTR|nr:hypothetical protein [Portunus trituberculatus]